MVSRYPAKIIELDDTDNTVLIHFEGWNHRFDEWMRMDSDRLRPVTRHSGRKERREKRGKQVSAIYARFGLITADLLIKTSSFKKVLFWFGVHGPIFG